ncbi:flagella synthesis protein FlgN [Legionella sp. km772]|uniref:flagella synthesis protein FlgN n=1 Tax=Legionella sp. km772 TaxID=2498111 RepID=UPI000F8DD0FD|nr:flagellar protein FlgN [Legionella sp. km772]RUR11963.1 flagellar protein FlgN [Legionella sp. km772]
MNNNNDVQVLAKHLKQEIEWIRELNTILVEEKEVLTNRQFEKLEEIADKKQALSNNLEASSKERLSLIGDPETQSPSEFLQKFLKECPPQEASLINNLNKELSNELTKCRELNTINGQVIATNIHTREEIVNILSGKGKDVSVYTATGNIKSSKKGEGHHREA